VTHEPSEQDASLDRLLERRLSRPRVDDAEELCVDAATLASLLDGGLADDERERVESHLARCADCRQALRLLVQAEAEAGGTVGGTVAPMLREVPPASRPLGTTVDARQQGVPAPMRPPARRGFGAGVGGARTWLPIAASLIAAAGLWFALRPEQATRLASPETSVAVAPQAPAAAATDASRLSGSADTAAPSPASPSQPAAQASAQAGPPPTASGAPAEAESTVARADEVARQRQAGRFESGLRPPMLGGAQASEKSSAARGEAVRPPDGAKSELLARNAATASAAAATAPTVPGGTAAGTVAGAPPAVSAATPALPSTPAPTAAEPESRRAMTTERAAARDTAARDAVAGQPAPGAAERAVAEARPAPAPASAPVSARAKAVGIGASFAAPGAPVVVTVASPGGARSWQFMRSGEIRVSEDAGKSWAVEFTQPGARFAAGSAPSVDVCWAVGAGGLVVRRGAADHRWTRLTLPVEDDLVAVFAKDAMNASVTTAAGVTYETRDGGLRWSRQ
jgi:hypothetical protein